MAAKPQVTFPRRGELYLVDFDPAIGAEIQKRRPGAVLQNDVSNRFSPVTIVAALSSKVASRTYPTEVFVRASDSGLDFDSLVLLNQIRTIDKHRLLRRIGMLPPVTMARVDEALLVSLGLVEE